MGLEVDAFSGWSFSSEAEACLEAVFCFLDAVVARFLGSGAASSGCRRFDARPVCDLVIGREVEGSVEGVSLA